jgi:chemotaxis protein methyltransferase CheR
VNPDRATFAANPPQLGASAFDALRRLIHARAGIALSDSKRVLVESRLAGRLRALGMSTYAEYAALLEREPANGDETREMLNCITTNKTSFYREPHHFDLLVTTIVPALVERARQTGRRQIRVWSAGCSTGQEPYSIAIALREALGSLADWDVRILASDLDTNVLRKAEEAVYDAEDAAAVPSHLRAKAFEDAGQGRVHVVDALRKIVTFRRINFVEEQWNIQTRFDVVFCRNVVIYFDRDTQKRLYRRIADLIHDDGYFVAGHSESLHWIPDLFTPAGKTAYRLAGKPGAASSGRSVRPASGISLRPPRPSRRPARISLRPSRIGTRSARTSVTPARLSHRPPRASVPPPPEVAIHAGGVHVSADPVRIRTVLGSCIAACLYDPVARIGGMNHFMLPTGTDDELPARFGVHAMEMLINGMLKLGAHRERLVAKVFGGANVMVTLGRKAGVAEQNIAFIEEFLAEEGIEVVARKLGGDIGLSVHFETATGRAFVRTLAPAQTLRVVELEEKPVKVVVHPPAQDVTFF